MPEVARSDSSRMMRVAAIVAAAASLGACTIVRVQSESGIRTRYFPGVAVIQVTRADSLQLVEVESIGAAVIGNQANIGWSHSRIALVPQGRCQLIAWRVELEQVAALRNLYGPGTEICDQEGETR